ncbi:MAG: hypothetical protein M3R25_07275 [Bacteroidota bacterium]|nr:hypothetical protein [Bacteroidota bacterium]
MKKIKFLLYFFTFLTTIMVQEMSWSQENVNSIFSSPSRIEKLKNGDDCKFISYSINEENKTETRRDDRYIGTFVFASGADCQKCFDKAQKHMKNIQNEKFALPVQQTLTILPGEKIHSITAFKVVNVGYTKAYATYFIGNQKTPQIADDDIVLGFDLIIDSADPDAIYGQHDITWIEALSPEISNQIDLFSNESYSLLRESIVNRNQIVEKLRSENKLKDITPLQDIKRVGIHKTQ